MFDFKMGLEMLNGFRTGAPLGDVAVLKFAAINSSPQHLNQELEKYKGKASSLGHADLENCPMGSLGEAYFQHLKKNNLMHLTISPSVLERFKDDPYSIRYIQTHDLTHVLTGFDTGLSGEAGVFAFTVGQKTAPYGEQSLKYLPMIYSLVSPTQRKEIKNNMDVGFQMGQNAKPLLTQPLEEWIERPLQEVREELQIDLKYLEQIQPSKESWYAKALYKLAGRS